MPLNINYKLYGLLLIGLTTACSSSNRIHGSTTTNDSNNSNNAIVSNTNNSNTMNSNAPMSNANNSNVLLTVDFENGLPTAFNLVGIANIVTSKAAHGTHSLELQGGAGYGNPAFLVTEAIFPLSSDALFVRYYTLLSKPLTQYHVALSIVSNANQSPSNPTELRFSGQYGILVWNYNNNNNKNDALRISADNTNFYEPQDANVFLKGGVSLSTKDWTCIEYMVDIKNQALHTYINGMENQNMAVTKLSDWDTPLMPNTSPWIPMLTTAEIGYRDYVAAGPNTIYVDDVVFATSRIGCL